MDENWEVCSTKYARVWFSHFQSRKSSIGLLAWKRSDNLKFHTSLHSQPSGQWAECLSRHHQTYTGRRLLLCGGWRVLSILVKLVIDRWVIVVIDCTRSIVEYYYLHVHTYYCGVNLFLKEVKTPYCLQRWCETPSVIQQQQKKKWVFW